MKLSNNVISIEVAPHGSIEVAPHGAELVSLVRKGREYMWNGDAKFWNRHAPILFPAVGKPFNNEIRIDGQVFTMKQHGFARDCEFEEAGEGILVMKDVQPENYPYRFALEAQYKLDGNRVDITWTILNLDKRDLCPRLRPLLRRLRPARVPRRRLRLGGRQPRAPAGARPPAGRNADYQRNIRARCLDH